MMKYQAEMGFTHRELLKGLPNAVFPYNISKTSDQTYSIINDDQIATLTIGDERMRKIAALELPVIDVEISFQNFNAIQHQAFLDRFKKFLHRGGG